jgi:hypothetical protein
MPCDVMMSIATTLRYYASQIVRYYCKGIDSAYGVYWLSTPRGHLRPHPRAVL